MKKDVKEKFREFLRGETARAEHGLDPVEEVMKIAAYSDDVRARLMSIRMLARELGADNLQTPPRWDARWKVIR